MIPTLEQLQQSIDLTLPTIPDRTLDELGNLWVMLNSYKGKYKKNSTEYKLIVTTVTIIDKQRKKLRTSHVPVLSAVEQEIQNNKDK